MPTADSVPGHADAGEYFRENFYVTTSGIFRTQALLNALLEVGSDRILFAVDTPFEATQEIVTWFDSCSISETDRAKIGRTNAAKLFGMNAPKQ